MLLSEKWKRNVFLYTFFETGVVFRQKRRATRNFCLPRGVCKVFFPIDVSGNYHFQLALEGEVINK
ncbi:MAG: hypothetical protein COX79_02050 [Candidatus Levybacteria bacterium CG_4_10_14_0_2_um_filter_36_16]|nr:MAG: hypothetical protein AUK12_02525 [Candidatus Levybacteria bacterium CG2_30_37_29]PIR79500.1 MAG: hypothetical protein COU26_00795 [Candidatus Levybacteria bacterium CG10_big_fil_rev_8_21_14_0_10_36_30]PIZ97512.1 MAG: hypothetical protein COX79_02050 [Candidatus Levybacteria bacterium CG_4_10_14_0_2_um_filter_36_16]